jgi:3-isopropylmalate/(R)-2-methylmalate dehydratase small subunit
MKKGHAWRYGDDVNTDVIFPGKYTYAVMEPDEMAKHALEDLDPDFAKSVQPGDVIVSGKNFGCGSSREQAATCLKYAGIQAVIAKSFARIFYRNAINQGLLVIQSVEAADSIQQGDEVAIDFQRGEIVVNDKNVFSFPSLPDSVLGILEAGGLIPYTKKKISKERSL